MKYILDCCVEVRMWSKYAIPLYVKKTELNCSI